MALIGFVSLFCALIPFVLIRYGPTVRSWSKVAMAKFTPSESLLRKGTELSEFLYCPFTKNTKRKKKPHAVASSSVQAPCALRPSPPPITPIHGHKR